MQESVYVRDNARVAPLRIQKSYRDFNQPNEDGTDSESQVHDIYSPRQKFQNFLRASYPFQPQDEFSASTITLPLDTGDIVLVHSIHSNGWADGTLLETGQRGWLPTNYCEPYDYTTMRPLLKALTEFWDVIRSSSEATLELYKNHDYMRGMVAGVRFLLDKSNCLTRDACVVKQHDSIRRMRKCLLADLAVLVKASKLMQTMDSNSLTVTDCDSILDDMLLKAFTVVTRAVAFYDIWSEEVAFTRNPGASPRTDDFCYESVSPTGTAHPHISTIIQGSSQQTSVYGASKRTSMRTTTFPHYSRPRPASINRPPTLTHRMSYTSRTPAIPNPNLASEQLTDTWNAFLGILGTLVGSHIHSRSSSELLLTTHQAIKSCRRLLEIVEIILEHNRIAAPSLENAKEILYDKLTSLTEAARSVLRPLDAAEEDMIYLPEQGQQLVNAATACVMSARTCVDRARDLLEYGGDFELDVCTDRSGAPSPDHHSPTDPPPTTLMTMDTTAEGPEASCSTTEVAPVPDSPPRTTGIALPASTSSEFWTPVTQDEQSPTSDTSTDSDRLGELPIQHKSLLRSQAHGSDSTLVSSARDSGPSFVSTSTRATSPDIYSKFSPKLVDESDDFEDSILEQQFAHELLISAEGKIIGGSLNAIVERLTSHDTTPEAVFVSMVYLTFRLFATSLQFAEALVHRFDYIQQSPNICKTVRLRTINVFKGWLETHWRHDCDEPAIPFIRRFVHGQVVPEFNAAGRQLSESLEIVTSMHGPAVPRVLSAIGKTNTASTLDTHQQAPSTVLSKAQLNLLKNWKAGSCNLTILDFDSLELARQLTIKTSDLFCSILPEELLGTEFSKPTSSLSVNVRAISTLSTDLANLVMDTILALEDAKKRALTIKQWIKIAARCVVLQNYETAMAIVASLSNSTISRLKRTWDLVPQKNKLKFDELKTMVDHSKNFATLRKHLEDSLPPCLPYMGLYLTDLTFVDHGNPSTREIRHGDDSIIVINLDKHLKTAKIISDLQRFQIPHRLASIDELQTWLQNEFVRVRAAGERNFQNQYRRSLMIEPRDNQITTQSRPKLSAFHSMSALTNKSFLDWTNSNRNSRIPEEKENDVPEVEAY